jgi:drug/metabolite transporter (DMT)-like permease
MTPAVIAIVLSAALLHAAWNALLKSGGDRFHAMVIMSVAASMACLPAAAILPLPDPRSWPAILVSAMIHVAYNLFLVRAYAHGDLGQVYPIARGSSPLLVTVGAAALAGEKPSGVALAGIILVSLGIFSLAQRWTKGTSASGMRVALATGVLIAAYTVTDGLGGRLSQNPPSYAVWLFIVEGVPMAVIYWVMRGWRAPLLAGAETAKAAAGGLVSLLAYGMVIWAASIGPMGSVSALRETSVVFAALMGRFFLAEDLSPRRLASCMAVAAGAVLLGHSI